MEDDVIDPEDGGAQKLKLPLAYRGALLREVMLLAMHNLATTQKRDQERFRHAHGGGYTKPKALFILRDFVTLKKPKRDTLTPPVRPHILWVVELRECGVVVLQAMMEPQ